VISKLIVQHRLDGVLYGQSEFQICGSVAEVHNDMFKFSANIYRDLLLDVENIKQLLRLNGISKLRVVGDANDLRIKKYWKLMGFLNPISLEVKGKSIHYAEMEI